MNPFIEIQKATPVLLVAVLLGCFGLSPSAHAVVPAPDGCYPGFTTAEGCAALNSLTTGAGNTGVGWRSLFLNTTGSFNTALGAGALLLNNGDTNTAIGAAALLLNTTGPTNTAVGVGALSSNTFGGGSTAVGYQALASQTGRGGSTAIGSRALASQTDGEANTATGAAALESTTGSRNTANGFTALRDSTGNDNTALGAGAGGNVTTASNVICIGAGVFGANVDNSCYIGNIFGSTSANGVGVLVNSNGRLGTMTSSARYKDEIKPMAKASEALFALTPVTFRYKKEIDSAGIQQLGLVAEDVEKVNPDLIVRDKEGKPYSVRYDQVNAMLLNEFLKEHKAFVEEQRKVQEQGASIARLEQQIEALNVGLQKVSAQLAAARPSEDGFELSKFATRRIRRGGPAPQTVLNNR
jgi:endosialidase-like protein